MHAVAGPHSHFLICYQTKSVENVLFSNHVKRICVSGSFPCRAAVPVCSTSGITGGHDSEKSNSPSPCNGRRLFLSLLSGTALFTCVEKNSTALAAGEESSEPVPPESIIPEVAGPPKPAVLELEASGEAAEQEAPAEGNALIRKLLARSKANKEKNDKARLDDYYKRNYKEYFEYIEGTIRSKKKEDLTEAEAGIIEWLKNNK